jgi:RNA recognition motif-containing protein
MLGSFMNQDSNKKLYVGSLPYSTTEDELRDLFGQFGPVSSVRIISDKFTGQSKGFGFVEMESADDAQKAIEGVNGAQLSGRTLVVNTARPPQERERSGQGERRGGGGGWGGGEGRGRRDRSRG